MCEVSGHFADFIMNQSKLKK